jgi:hypothetical protein
MHRMMWSATLFAIRSAPWQSQQRPSRWGAEARLDRPDSFGRANGLGAGSFIQAENQLSIMKAHATRELT